jgi:flagellar motor switch/type III secretory pathway protein FliN
MISKFDFHQLLEPFATNIKATLKLPSSVTLESILELIKAYFDNQALEIKCFTPAPSAHLPVQNSLFCIKADPIQAPFYVSFSAPTKSKLLETFFGSKEPFSDDRLVTKFLDDLNFHKLFQGLSFYLSESMTCHESLLHVKVELLIQGSYPLIIDLYFPESFTEAFDELYKGQIETKSDFVPLFVHINIGHVKLSNDQIQSLKSGYILVVDDLFYNPETQKGMGHLVCKNHNFAQVRLSPHSIKFLDFNPLPEEAPMEQHVDSPLKSLSDLTLELQVEFTTLKLQMKDLEHLTQGQTIEFHKEHPTHVYLTLQGQRIAKGELVKVGEQMAFLVEEIRHG